jgi:hypothetical protein
VTYCIGVMLDKGMIFASDSRTLYSGGNPRRLPRKPGRARIRDQRIMRTTVAAKGQTTAVAAAITLTL